MSSICHVKDKSKIIIIIENNEIKNSQQAPTPIAHEYLIKSSYQPCPSLHPLPREITTLYSISTALLSLQCAQLIR